MPPVNDNFANAVTLAPTSGTVGPYVIDDATLEGGEPQPFGPGPYNTVWFTFVAEQGGAYTFDTLHSPAGDAPSGDGEGVTPPFGNLDTQIALYEQTGSGFAGLGLLSNNDDAASDPSGLWSSISGTLGGPGTYYVQVGVFDASYVGSVVLNYSIPALLTPPVPGADCPSDVEYWASAAGTVTYPSSGGGPYTDGFIDWYEPVHNVGDLLVWMYHGTKNDVSVPVGYTELFSDAWDNAPTSPPIHGPNSTTAGPAWKANATLIVAWRIAAETWTTPGTVVDTISGLQYSDPFTTDTESGDVLVSRFVHTALSDGHSLPWVSPAIIVGSMSSADYQADLGPSGGAFGGFYPAVDPHPRNVTVADVSADHPGNHIFATIVAVHGPVLAEDLGGGANSMSLDPPEFYIATSGDVLIPDMNQTYFSLYLSNKDYFEPDDPAFHDVVTTGTPGGAVTGHAGDDWADGFVGVAGTDFYNWTLTGGVMMFEFVIQGALNGDCLAPYWGINAVTPA